MCVMAVGTLGAFHPLQSNGPRILDLRQHRGAFDLEKQGMAEKCRRLLLEQPSAVQEPIKREEVQERRCTIRQNAPLVWLLFRRFTQRHERELVKEYTEGQHKLASAALFQPSLVEIRSEVDRTPTNMGLSLSVRPFLLRDLAAQVPSIEHPSHRHLCEREAGISKCDVMQTTIGNHSGGLRVRERGRDDPGSGGDVGCRGRAATRKGMPALR